MGCDEVQVAKGADERGRKFCTKYDFTVTENSTPPVMCNVRVRSNSNSRGKKAPPKNERMSLQELVAHNESRD